MEINLKLLKQTIQEMIETKNDRLLIETFSFEERLDIINEIEAFSDQFKDIDWLYGNLFSAKEVVQTIDNYRENNIVYYIMLLTSDLDDAFLLNEITNIYKSSPDDEMLNISYISLNLKEDKNKIVCLDYVANQYQKRTIINSLEKDDNKIECLKFLEYDSDKVEVIKTLTKDVSKLACLDLVTSEKNKLEIIKSLDDDSTKFSFLKPFTEYSDYEYNAGIISSLSDDSIKKKYLDDIRWSFQELLLIICSLNEDSDKMHYLKQEISEPPHRNRFSISGNISEVIKSFKEDANKIICLEYLESSYDIVQVISSIQDMEVRIDTIVKCNYIELLINTINHYDSVLNLKNINEDVIRIYSEKYSLNYDNLLSLTSKFGYEILRNVENRNIASLINSNKEDLEKTLKLFDIKGFAMDQHDMENILNAVAQREFRLNHHEIIRIVEHIEEFINAKDKDSVVLELSKIINESDVLNILIEKNINLEQLIEGLFSNKNKNYLDIVHKMTDQYIRQKREEYVVKRVPELFSSLSCERTYEKNITIKKLFELESAEKIFELINLINRNNLSSDAVALLESEEILKQCIMYKKNPQSFSSEELGSIKGNLKYLSELLNALCSQKRLNYFASKSGIKEVKYGMPEMSNSDIIAILREFDFKCFKEKTLDGKAETYEKLESIIRKYKFVLWGDTFEDALEKVGLSLDSGAKAGFITNFYSFYPELEEKLSIGTLLDEAIAYAGSSFRYKNLLDFENSRLICKNPGPHASLLTAKQRLAELPSYIRTMYDRHYITVPPINQTITLSNSKPINVSVGKTSELINLTLGERTGACMRIGGHAENLFDFCLENENGFHVVFSNPETGEFVSRVSGFRNGNTVFLNELRISKDKSYSNNDLVDAARQLSNYFIEQTKGSNNPINNVVISNEYAMAGHQTQYLGVSNIKEGFEYFYSDVRSSAVLLASSNEDNSLVPVVLGPQKSERYSVLRRKIKTTNFPLEIKQNLIRLKMTTQLLEGVPIDEWMIPKYEAELEGTLYFGEDWYIFMDPNGNILEKHVMIRDERNMELANLEIQSLGLGEFEKTEEAKKGGLK